MSSTILTPLVCYGPMAMSWPKCDIRSSLRTARRVRQVALADIKDDLSRFLRLAASEEIVITRHGKPAGVLIGFDSEDDWFDYGLEHDPGFLRRIAEAREALRTGRGMRLEDVP